MKVAAKEVVRVKEKLFGELKLDSASDAALVDAMAKHPILMNRPIVTVKKGAKVSARLCRPSETVEDMF
jgi:arsenate reductase